MFHGVHLLNQETIAIANALAENEKRRVKASGLGEGVGGEGSRGVVGGGGGGRGGREGLGEGGGGG